MVSERPEVRAGCSIRAMPKSRIFARPSLVRKMLSGLMSRWMMPFSCAAARPSAIWLATSTAFCGMQGAAAQAVEQRLAFEQLRDRVRHRAERARVVDREDVRMVERRDRARLAVEPMEAVGVVRRRVGQQLQGDLAPQTRVAGAVDLAHAALSERSEDLVGAELFSGGQGHAA